MSKQIKDNIKEVLNVKNLTDNSADIYFYGDIVGSYWDSWDDTDQYPENVKYILDEVGDRDLNIYVNSGGGSVTAGMTIYNMLKRQKGHKKVYVDGIAGSIASVIALVGDEVIIPSNAYFMIHKPYLSLSGNADDLRKYADTLDLIQQGILNIYAENLQEGVSIDTIKEFMDSETWFTGLDVVKYFTVKLGDSLEVFNKVDSEYLNKCNIPKELTEKVENPLEDTEIENKVDEDEISNQLQIEKEKLMLELELM